MLTELSDLQSSCLEAAEIYIVVELMIAMHCTSGGIPWNYCISAALINVISLTCCIW